MALLLAWPAAQPAAARPAAAETILVRVHHSYAVCAGLCPDFAMRIGPRGEVVSRSLHTSETHRFRATAARLSAFRAILDPLRPAGESRLDRECARATSADGTPDPLDEPGPDDLEIRWIGADGDARLTACAYTHMAVRRTVESALRALGADPYSGARARHSA